MSVLNDLMEKAPERILREFARKCALRHVEKIKPHCSEKEYELIFKWLETGDESIRLAARSAARSAAISVAYSVANSAAYSAAGSAAYSVARSAARSAALWAAHSAACSAACSAADSARWSETEWQEQTLSEMMRESNYE